MLKEIGSEFWDIPLNDKIENCIPFEFKWFISGTSALKYIIEDINLYHKINKVGLPSWCCDCMIKPFLEKKINIKFYDVFIDNTNYLTCDYSNTSDCDVTLLISYFGYNQQIEIGNPSGIIIRDITHSVFSNKFQDAQYYFGSLRKWCGFLTGGFAWKNSKWMNNYKILPLDKDYLSIRQSAMIDKKKYLNGVINNKDYLMSFENCEFFLDNCDIMNGYDDEIFKLRKLDINFIKKCRRSNALYLLNYLGDLAIFNHLESDDCPLFVPIILPKEIRNNLRKELINNNIYCPVHWQLTEIHNISLKSKKIYENELSIVCDQRYTIGDMKKIVDIILKFRENNNF